ncbi:DUF1134 domain-containing protein [Fontimonas sp. SYSU GA230001]|uniref:DUF1134 domain-containing protein n=1 Tax=Fontimonas sp. SYSU GA230001 TaxID=3142450 RepID=UPI0032B38DB6
MKSTLLLALPVLLAACTAPRAYDAPRQPEPPRSILVAQADSPERGDMAAQATPGDTYSAEEIAREASQFFGETSENLAKAIERTFSDHGRPTAYVLGREGGGAAVVGLRFGEGTLRFKTGGSLPVYWQGPTVGWDFGGSASKVFTLVYNLHDSRDLFQRFPAVDGSLYVVAGFSVNYQRSGDIVLAPIRTGVGLRAGASLGYIHYTRDRSFIPF